MLRPLAIAFLLFVVAEMATLIALGKWIGIIPTLLVVLGGGIVGAWLARVQAVRTAWRARKRLAQGALPAVELTDGLFISLAAALFIIPGVLTDIAALLLLFGPTRSLLRHAVIARFTRGSFLGRLAFGRRPPRSTATPAAARGDEVIDARVVNTRVVDE